jgi:hypothetical protein
MPSTKKPFKTHRSYKQLNEEKFLQDLEQALTTLIENEDNVNEAYLNVNICCVRFVFYILLFLVVGS